MQDNYFPGKGSPFDSDPNIIHVAAHTDFMDLMPLTPSSDIYILSSNAEPFDTTSDQHLDFTLGDGMPSGGIDVRLGSGLSAQNICDDINTAYGVSVAEPFYGHIKIHSYWGSTYITINYSNTNLGFYNNLEISTQFPSEIFVLSACFGLTSLLGFGPGIGTNIKTDGQLNIKFSGYPTDRVDSGSGAFNLDTDYIQWPLVFNELKDWSEATLLSLSLMRENKVVSDFRFLVFFGPINNPIGYALLDSLGGNESSSDFSGYPFAKSYLLDIEKDFTPHIIGTADWTQISSIVLLFQPEYKSDSEELSSSPGQTHFEGTLSFATHFSSFFELFPVYSSAGKPRQMLGTIGTEIKGELSGTSHGSGTLDFDTGDFSFDFAKTIRSSTKVYKTEVSLKSDIEISLGLGFAKVSPVSPDIVGKLYHRITDAVEYAKTQIDLQPPSGLGVEPNVFTVYVHPNIYCERVVLYHGVLLSSLYPGSVLIVGVKSMPGLLIPPATTPNDYRASSAVGVMTCSSQGFDYKIPRFYVDLFNQLTPQGINFYSMAGAMAFGMFTGFNCTFIGGTKACVAAMVASGEYATVLNSQVEAGLIGVVAIGPPSAAGLFILQDCFSFGNCGTLSLMGNLNNISAYIGNINMVDFLPIDIGSPLGLNTLAYGYPSVKIIGNLGLGQPFKGFLEYLDPEAPDSMVEYVSTIHPEALMFNTGLITESTFGYDWPVEVKNARAALNYLFEKIGNPIDYSSNSKDLYIDWAGGSDDSGDGSSSKPFKTYTKALDKFKLFFPNSSVNLNFINSQYQESVVIIGKYGGSNPIVIKGGAITRPIFIYNSKVKFEGISSSSVLEVNGDIKCFNSEITIGEYLGLRNGVQGENCSIILVGGVAQPIDISAPAFNLSNCFVQIGDNDRYYALNITGYGNPLFIFKRCKVIEYTGAVLELKPGKGSSYSDAFYFDNTDFFVEAISISDVDNDPPTNSWVTARNGSRIIMGLPPFGTPTIDYDFDFSSQGRILGPGGLLYRKWIEYVDKPTLYTDPGEIGQLAFDGSYAYYHDGTRWQRVSIDATWT